MTGKAHNILINYIDTINSVGNKRKGSGLTRRAARLLSAAIAVFTVLAPIAGRPVGCAAQARSILDDTGHSFSLPERTPGRIISMAPNITEILFALGLGDNLAGVTRFCDCPAETAAKPKIGGLIDPNIEVIQSLKPDLIIAFRGNPKKVVERLRLLGFPLFVLDAGADFESLFLMINKIGLVTARTSEASRLVDGLRSRVRRMTDLAKGGPSRPRVAFLLSGRGLWTAGHGSFLTGLVETAGGTNVAASLHAKWSVYKKEQLAADDPDVIFILAPSAEAFAAGREQLERMFPAKGLRAVREGRVFHLDENTASRLGPRLVDTLERTAALIHPELFGSGK